MKSAYELAMERLEKKDPAKVLTDAQKQQIAEVDSEINAKLAERRLLLEGEMAKATDLENRDQLQRELSSEVARLEEKRTEKKERIRKGR